MRKLQKDCVSFGGAVFFVVKTGEKVETICLFGGKKGLKTAYL